MALTQWREIRGRMSVALEVGVEASLLLEDIYYWVNHNREREHNFNDGFYWTVNSYKDFMDRFPCFTLGKIKRLLAQLRSAGFIVAKSYKNYDPRNRSLWYRITQKTAEHYTSLAEAAAMQQKSKADSPSQGHKSNLTNASVKSDLCIGQNEPMHRSDSHFSSILAKSTNSRARTEREPADADISFEAQQLEAFESVEDEELKAALKSFAHERQQRKNPISQHAAYLLLRKLEKLAPCDTNKQIEIVQASIINGWKDFFPLPAPKQASRPQGDTGPVSNSRNLYEETMAKVEKLTSDNGGNDHDMLF